jgi:hypothetical protein
MYHPLGSNDECYRDISTATQNSVSVPEAKTQPSGLVTSSHKPYLPANRGSAAISLAAYSAASCALFDSSGWSRKYRAKRIGSGMISCRALSSSLAFSKLRKMS